MSLSNLIKRLQDIMRKDSGVDGDAQRLAQIVWLIFLKVYDYKEEEAELEDDYIPVIPEGYRWRDWAVGESVKTQMTGPDLLNFVNNELIPVLGGNAITKDGKQVIPFDKTDARSMLVKEVMGDATNYMKNGYLLRDVVNLFNEVDFEDSSEAHEFNDMYEGLLRGLQSAGTMGEFYTNRAITTFAIEKVDPQIDGVLADWAAGTGGFLISALEHMQKQVKPGDNEAQKKLQNAVRGGELKPLAYKLNVTNLLLHGIELPNIRYGDSLAEKNLGDFHGSDLVEYCALNPPYGGVALPEDIQSFPADLRSSETADLFVALSVKRLKNGGRGVIVLPDGFLFGNDNAKVSIKKYLMKECNLHTIIRLPQSCFAPYTSIATNLLFFDKGESTQEVWFYRLDMPEGYKHFSKTKPMKKEHFDCVREWWDNRAEIQDEKADEAMSVTYKAKKYTIDEIAGNNYNLDLCGYPTEEKVILSPEETMENFIRQKKDLEEKLEIASSALHQFLSGNEDIELHNIASISQKLIKLNSKFPSEMRSSLLQAAMQGKLTQQLPEESVAEIENYLHIDSKLCPIKDVPFDIPENWKWIQIGNLGESADTDSFADGPFGSNLKREHQISEHEVRIIQLSNIGENGWKNENEKYTSYDHLEKVIPRCEVTPGCFVIAKMMPAGRTILVPELGTRITLGSDAMKFKPNSILNKKYLLYAMRSQAFLGQVYAEVHGITRVRTTLNGVKGYVLPIPPLAEQQRIVEKLDKLLPLCDALKEDSMA